MNFTRPIIFWIATLAAVVAIVILLRGVLLPVWRLPICSVPLQAAWNGWE